MTSFRNCILVLCLASLTTSQTTESPISIMVTSTAMSTTTTSTATSQILSQNPLETPHPLSSYVWHMRFVGMSENASQPWGPFGLVTECSYAIVVNDSNPALASSSLVRSTDVLFDAYAENNAEDDGGYKLDIITSGGSTMILGTNSAFGATYGSTTLNETVPAVPFGLNLGHNNSWHGSLILGGNNSGASYDANRVANGSWVYIPESVNGNGTFLKDGKQKLTNITIQQYSSLSSKVNQAPFDGAGPIHQAATYSAELDINNDAIVLPAGLNLCNTTNFTVTLNTRSIQINTTSSYANNLTISIPTSLTRSTDRCYTASTNTTNGTVILGRPFFQAAYLMIPDQTGQIWLAAAHQYNLFPRAELFLPNQTLIAAADPSTTPISSSTPSPSSTAAATDGGSENKTASIIGGTLGGVFGLALVSWIAFLIFRHRKHARKLFLKPVSTETELLNGIPMENLDG